MKSDFRFKKLVVLCMFSAHALISSAQEFKTKVLDEGIKPTIGLLDNLPFLAYLRESAADGYVKTASYNSVSKKFDFVKIKEGNFYGPANISVYEDSPYFIFHDHALNGGGSHILSDDGDSWNTKDASNTGHDGWDARLIFDSKGDIHVSSIDAIPFSGPGVEYSYFDGNTWLVETIGSGALDYGFGTAIALNDLEEPMIFYYNSVSSDLEMAVKSNNLWEVLKLDSIGDVGKYVVSYQQEDTLYLGYLKMLGEDSAEVRMAEKVGADIWQFFTLDTVVNIDGDKMGVQALDLKITDQLYIAICTEKELSLLTMKKNIGIISTESIVRSGSVDTVFSQMVDLEIDADGFVHLAVGIQINGNDSIMYATNHETILYTTNPKVESVQCYPNPVEDVLHFSSVVDRVEIFDLKGRIVGVWNIVKDINTSTFLSGLYFVRAGDSTFKFVKK